MLAKGIMKKEDVLRLPPRRYNKIPIFTKSGYRMTYWKYWSTTLNPLTYYKDIVTFYQRGRRGWADRDCWSLDTYMARWIGDALHHLQSQAFHYGTTDEKGIQEYKRMIDAWDSYRHFTDDCDCIDDYKKGLSTKFEIKEDGSLDLGDTSWVPIYKEQHTNTHFKNFRRGAALFLKRFPSLWW